MGGQGMEGGLIAGLSILMVSVSVGANVSRVSLSALSLGLSLS